MKKTIAIAIIAALSIFGGIHAKNSTVFNPASKVDLQHVSYYGQYNSYNNSYRTNYVNGYYRSNGHYVNGYYRS